MKDKFFESSERIRFESSWEYISKAVLHASASNKKLNVAVNLESHDNHEIKF